MLVPAHIQEHYKLAKQFQLPVKQVVDPYFKGEKEEALNPNVETQLRTSVIAVIKNEKDNTYLCVDAQKRLCRSFVLRRNSRTSSHKRGKRGNRIYRCFYYKNKCF